MSSTPGGRRFGSSRDSTSGISPRTSRSGVAHRFTGIVGQRATRRRARLDGYRIWLRDRADIGGHDVRTPGASPAPSDDGSGTGDVPAAGPVNRDGRAARRRRSGRGRHHGWPRAAGQRRPTDRDRGSTGGIEALLPVDVASPPVGARVRIVGAVGRAYGAPQAPRDGGRGARGPGRRVTCVAVGAAG